MPRPRRVEGDVDAAPRDAKDDEKANVGEDAADAAGTADAAVTAAARAHRGNFIFFSRFLFSFPRFLLLVAAVANAAIFLSSLGGCPYLSS
mmetsp:Transcript_15295/g.44408  ORF Transcript_15295/g.44408 Transcript_15295/m.44408 type:complete len:91 (-) Transcript_15295:83-355(-)